ncbi:MULTISPECIES: LysR family transcriptional regulator [unclassified Mesorhizobium]|uniref:LysR family transcriptional regulator n=1 Tax=unclassified Mesorhizobium TaxID=325217 RepID=UPI001125F827|nr:MULTISPECIES: LysR family transcriptional regulator [unclassified Mesorhizobium]TPK95321.1 LysR family transcriptional regulator [Mesorhizobium sp. B2-4-16]TPL61016.1 LysR family transcriptional regulator [Mesorhizobium sp. B2-4-3]
MWRSIQLVTLYSMVVIAEEGSFLGASRRLRIHHSALSRRVKHLELILGVTLLERHPGGVRATAAGQRFLAKLRCILKDLDDILRQIEPAGHGNSDQASAGSNGSACNCALLNAIARPMGHDHAMDPLIALLRGQFPAP